MSKYALSLLFLILFGTGFLSSQAPTISSQPANLTVTLGQGATFSVTTSGEYRYQWQRDNVPIAGATSSSYTFTPTVADTGHIFNVLVYAANGAAAGSGSAWLHVAPRTDIPTVTNVESFGINTASQAADSFGLGVDSAQPWEFAATANMGGKWVRADGCQWEHIEVQVMPGNTSGGFAPALAPDCLAEVTSAAQNGLHLDALSYFAPPSSQIATAVVASTVPAGATSLPLNFVTGTLAGYAARDLLIFGTAGLNSRIDYGAPVAGVSGSTLTLPEPSIAAIPAGTRVTINVLLYPPVLIPAQTSPTAYVSEPSVTAWLNYIHAVQTFMHSENVTGAVELWNEPEQSNELWDFPAGYYTTPGANFSIGNSGMALAFAAGTLPTVPGVRLLNGWTDLSGNSSLYNPAFSRYLPVSATQLNTVFLGESQHPYGNNPEQQAWLPAVVQADATQGVQNPFIETPIGGQVGANNKSQVWFNDLPAASGGIRNAVTETGINAGETEQQQARFNLRQFLSMSGNNIYPIIFYKAGNAPGWDWFGEDSAHTPYPVVTAFTGLLTDINQIAHSPVATYTSTSMPQVTSYQGYYPLATMTLVGSTSGARSNSVLFYAWQKSYTVPPAGTTGQENYGAAPSWTTLPSPTAAPVQVSIPSGSRVSFIKDLVTGSTVPFTVAGNMITYYVTDDPTEMLVTPGPSKVATVSVASTSVPYGSASATLSATVTYSAGSVPTGAFTFTPGTASKAAGVCTVTSTTTEVCTATYSGAGLSSWAAATYPLTGTLAADSNYGLVSSTGQFTIAPATATLSIPNVSVSSSSNTALLTASVAYAGALSPTGGVTFQVGTAAAVTATCGSSSPMICTAAYPLASIPVGTSTITAKLAAGNNYLSASGIATLTRSGSIATITVGSIPTTYGTTSVTLTATVSYIGNSPANAIYFQVAGGSAISATCKGTSSPLTCSAAYDPQTFSLGTYTLTANVSGSQWAVSQTFGSLIIGQATPTLSVSNETLKSGSASTVLYVNVIFTGSVPPSGAVTFSIDGGTPMIARYNGSSSVSPRTAIATATVSGLSVGRHTIKSALAGDANYKSTTGTATLIIN